MQMPVQTREFEKDIKTIQPLNTELLESFRKRLTLYLNHCRKKKYIFDFFNDIYTNMHNKNYYRPSLYEFFSIIEPSIPKEDEKVLQSLIQNFERENCVLCPSVLHNVKSEIIIDIFYDFCKSLKTEYIKDLPESSIRNYHI